MRIFFDFEFIEGGSAFVMEPISLGMVKENGERAYWEFDSVDWAKANEWVIDNVKPHLTGNTKSKEQISKEIIEFVGDEPEFWAYFADYDWVILCQLYGRMVDLPKGWPYFCMDVKQWMVHTGTTKKELDGWINNDREHNALADAHWNRKAYKWICDNKWELV